MTIESICPKCGKMGTQSIAHRPNKSNSKYNYLEMKHSKKKNCYIGRIRTTDEAMNEFTKPKTTEEFKKTLTNMVKEIRQLIRDYNIHSSKTKISVNTIFAKLKEILEKYGY